MNILPHKSWHVRTKRNIARVRKDEAKAAEEEAEKQRKIALAGQEARTEVLRQRASERLGSARAAAVTSGEIADDVVTSIDDVSLRLAPVTDIIQKDGHVNFFQDMEEGKKQGGVNQEAEQEKKKEQDDYEKKIGYLVYLGQDSLEQSKQRPWYAKIQRGGDGKTSKPDGGVDAEFEKQKTLEKSGFFQGLSSKTFDMTPEELRTAKFKNFQDPLNDIRKYLKTPGVAQKLDGSSTTTIKKKTEEKESRELSKNSRKRKKKEKKKHKKKAKKHHHHRKRESPSPSGSSSEGEEDEEDAAEERKRKNLEKLRAERLEREREERRRTEQLFAKLRGDTGDTPKVPEDKGGDNYAPRKVRQKYNAQFNPELARQNYDYDDSALGLMVNRDKRT